MASYAYGGTDGPGPIGSEFARPTPMHVLRAREAEGLPLSSQVPRAPREVDYHFVTDVGRPPIVPYEKPEMRRTKKGKLKPTGRMLPADPVTPNARKLLALAERAGMETNLIVLHDRCAVEGVDRKAGVGFRAHWTRGRADGATWHEREMRYRLEEDTRPHGLDERAKLAKAGHRDARTGDYRMRTVASPYGVRIAHAELMQRVSER